MVAWATQPDPVSKMEREREREGGSREQRGCAGTRAVSSGERVCPMLPSFRPAQDTKPEESWLEGRGP